MLASFGFPRFSDVCPLWRSSSIDSCMIPLSNMLYWNFLAYSRISYCHTENSSLFFCSGLMQVGLATKRTMQDTTGSLSAMQQSALLCKTLDLILGETGLEKRHKTTKTKQKSALTCFFLQVFSNPVCAFWYSNPCTLSCHPPCMKCSNSCRKSSKFCPQTMIRRNHTCALY